MTNDLQTKGLDTNYGIMHLVQDTKNTWLIMDENENNFGCVSRNDIQRFTIDRQYRNEIIAHGLTF